MTDFTKTNSSVVVHTFREGVTVRTVMRDAIPYFVAKDVALSLGYAKPDQAIRTHCPAAVTCPLNSGGQVRHVQVIPESDVFRLIMRSQLPAAEEFQDWVFKAVLPSLRKNGAYIVGQEDPNTSEELLIERAFMAIHKRLEMANAKNTVLEEQVEILAPKALAFETVVAKNRLTLRKFLRTLPGINLVEVNGTLVEMDILWTDGRTHYVNRKNADHLFNELLDAEHRRVTLYPTVDGMAFLTRAYHDGRFIMKNGVAKPGTLAGSAYIIEPSISNVIPID